MGSPSGASVDDRVFTTAALSTQMFPGILFLLPLYIIFVNIFYTATGIAPSTLCGLIITYLTFTLPFGIRMLTGYFEQISRDSPPRRKWMARPPR